MSSIILPPAVVAAIIDGICWVVAVLIIAYMVVIVLGVIVLSIDKEAENTHESET